ncbi:GntR family transcriptional regulator [Alcaligenes sp. SDU_A2]|uniref:GntR family transcriptional regulator n=1 Tax=Alcaligenes sp. SDU_A2 TaxID=3136634 RepID=UPI00311E8417
MNGISTTPSTALRVKREPMYLVIANQLRSLILKAELKPGSRVHEQYLSDLFDVSRTPLREALKVIAQEGLIELLPNKGARITAIDLQELREIFQVMTNLQALVAEQLLEHASDQDVQGLMQLHTAMVDAARQGDRDGYFKLNQNVHHEFSRLAGNSVLADIEKQLGVKIARARYMANLNPDRWLESVTEHGHIMHALQARDRAGLIAAMSEHMRNTGQAVLAGLPADGQD